MRLDLNDDINPKGAPFVQMHACVLEVLAQVLQPVIRPICFREAGMAPVEPQQVVELFPRGGTSSDGDNVCDQEFIRNLRAA